MSPETRLLLHVCKVDCLASWSIFAKLEGQRGLPAFSKDKCIPTRFLLRRILPHQCPVAGECHWRLDTGESRHRLHWRSENVQRSRIYNQHPFKKFPSLVDILDSTTGNYVRLEKQTSTLCPCCRSATAAVKPPMPAPTISTRSPGFSVRPVISI